MSEESKALDTYTGGKQYSVVKCSVKKANPWAPGDDEVHFPEGTRPTEEQMDVIADILEGGEVRHKVHGRNSAFVVDENGEVQFYLRRQKPKKGGFEKLSELETSCLVPLPCGVNGGSGRYRYLGVPRNPIKYIEEHWPAVKNPKKMAGMIFGNLDTIETVYQILSLPHFQRYKNKGWTTVELCGPSVMPHRFVPKGVSLAVHCEQPVAEGIKNYDDILAFFEKHVCEGFVVRTRNGEYRKCRADRLGFNGFEHLCSKKYLDDKRSVAEILKDDTKREWKGVYHTL